MTLSMKTAPRKSASLMDKITGHVVYRKLYHFIGGGAMIGTMLWMDKDWFILLSFLFILAYYLISKRITFAVIGILILFILTDSRFITLISATIWLVGDGLAGLIGALYGKQAWPWHPQKTITGTVSFFTGSFPAALAVLTHTSGASPPVLTLIAFTSSLSAAIIEMLPITFIRDRKADDNLIIILACGLIIRLLCHWLGVTGSI